MTMRPAKVKVIGKTYAVRYVTGSPLEEGDTGECDYDAAIISIRDGIESQLERSSLLHEVLHALDDQLNLRLTEKQIEGLENGLFQIAVDNPRFFAFVRKAK